MKHDYAMLRVVAEAIDGTVFKGIPDALGVQPEEAADFVQYLNENGFDLVPVTIIGSAGWTPSELKAYQAGIMFARHEGNRTYALPVGPDDA